MLSKSSFAALVGAALWATAAPESALAQNVTCTSTSSSQTAAILLNTTNPVANQSLQVFLNMPTGSGNAYYGFNLLNATLDAVYTMTLNSTEVNQGLEFVWPQAGEFVLQVVGPLDCSNSNACQVTSNYQSVSSLINFQAPTTSTTVTTGGALGLSASTANGLLMVSATSAPGTQYQVLVTDSSNNVRNNTYVSGADLQTGISAQTNGWTGGSYTVSVYGNCNGQCTSSNLMDSQTVAINTAATTGTTSTNTAGSCMSLSTSSSSSSSNGATSATSSVTVTDACLTSTYSSNSAFSVTFVDSNGKSVSQNAYTAAQLATGVNIDTSNYSSGTYNVWVQGPCSVGTTGNYQCGGQQVADHAQVKI